MFTEELNRIKKQGKLVSIYTNRNDTCKFIVGYVIGVNKQDFILALITPDGEYDGFLLKEVDSIYKIVEDELYLGRLLKLVSIKQTKVESIFKSNDLKNELLEFAQKHHKIVSIELINSGYDDCIGFVNSINETMCKVQVINESGIPDGISTIMKSDITQISYDDTDNRPRKLLYESK